MKNFICVLVSFVSVSLSAQSYEYKMFTVVESIVPNGLGRSRMISETETLDYKSATVQRTEDSKEKNKKKRSELRTNTFQETKLLNFYNLGGIRFNNIATNDAMVTSKINDLAAQGWELAFVNGGVESSGDKDPQGIFITRYIFKRNLE